VAQDAIGRITRDQQRAAALRVAVRGERLRNPFSNGLGGGTGARQPLESKQEEDNGSERLPWKHSLSHAGSARSVRAWSVGLCRASADRGAR
jgi:hypothetical protein